MVRTVKGETFADSLGLRLHAFGGGYVAGTLLPREQGHWLGSLVQLK